MNPPPPPGDGPVKVGPPAGTDDGEASRTGGGVALVTVEDGPAGVRLITLNDPARRNALSAALATELVEALRAAEAEAAVRAIVVTGAGGSFCAGGDVSGMGQVDGPVARSRMRLGLQELPRMLSLLDTPVIAAIDGAAVGAGLDLALGCDLRIASDRARFSTGFARVGLVAVDGGAWLLPRLIGTERALELLWTAEFVDAVQAERIGLVGRVVTADNLMGEAVSLAARIASGPPLAIALTKRLVRDGASVSLASSLETAASYAGLVAASWDHAEGVAALREKRVPCFQGR